jgi:hypothetical protein
LITSRLQLLQQADLFLGKYFSKHYVQKNILRMTDEDIETMNQEIEAEVDDPTAQAGSAGAPMVQQTPDMPPMMGGQDDSAPPPMMQMPQPQDQQNDPNAPTDGASQNNLNKKKQTQDKLGGATNFKG